MDKKSSETRNCYPVNPSFWSLIFEKNNIRYREAIIVNGEVNLNMVFDNMLIWYFSPQNTKVEARRQTVRNISKSFLFLNVVREDGYSLQYRAIRYKMMNDIGEQPSL